MVEVCEQSIDVVGTCSICPIQRRSIVGGPHPEGYPIAAEGIWLIIRETRGKKLMHLLEMLETNSKILNEVIV